MLNLIKFARYSFLILLLNGSLPGIAQHYPVMVSTIITPPYSARLSDYAESGSDGVQVVINPLDMSLESYKVKIKLIIESLDGRIRLETDPAYLPSPIYLNGGIPEILTGYDLEGLFDVNHLLFQKGLSKNEYLIRKKLPENYYRIGFVLLDYNRATLGGKTNEVTISNPGSALLGIFLNDPPLLNMPANNSKLRLSEPQQIVLQWTPRHKGSPNSAFTAEYVVRLFEVWNESFSAAAITQTQMPIFETITTGNRLIYGPSDPMLIPGNKYVWTVQARESEGRDMFRNGGISEAFMFTWGEACKTPENFNAVVVNGPAIEMKWNTSTGHTDFDIQYRTVGAQNWYDQNSLLSNHRIPKLTYNSNYETRVRANCGSYSSEFSEPVIIKTPEAPKQSFSCGAPGTVPTASPANPLLALPPGAIFFAGGFLCHVIESSANNGTFSGTCYVVIPFYGFAKVLHKFSNIRVNTDMQMFSGKLISVTDSSKSDALATKINDALRPTGTGFNNEQLEQLIEADTIVKVDGRIKTITVSDNGQVIVTLRNGNTEILEYKEGEKLIVSDKDGEQYVVENGKVITGSEALEAKASESAATQQVDNAETTIKHLPLVHFTPTVNMKYGFDSLKYPDLKGQYSMNTILGKEYILPYKAVATGGIDAVEATMSAGKGFVANGLGFRINQTVTVSRPSERVNARTVQVATLMKSDGNVLEAVYSMKDSSGNVVEETLGQLNIVAYDKQNIDLVIVPVGSRDEYKHFEINDQISKIYSQSVVQCNIRWDEPFNSQTWDINGDNIFDDTDNDNRMDYTPAMKALMRAFNKERGTEKQAAYIFLFDGEHASNDLRGYMPLNKQFGFIFTSTKTDPSTLAHNISHEVAHGVFNLRHTFSDENTYYQPLGSTDNLMDYGSADASMLNKYQWDLIHDPQSVLFSWLEDEAEAEKLDFSALMTLIDKIREANQKEYQSLEIMQDQCPNVIYKNVPLGDNKIDYLQMNCSKEFQNAEIDEDRINRLIKVEMEFGSNLMLSPGEKSLVYSQTTLGDAIAYQFHEVKKSNTIPLNIEMTDNFLFEFAVLKKDKEKFEDYIYGKPLSNTIKIYITRTNTGTNSTTGTLRTDDDAITGYTVELPRGTDSQCMTICGDDETPYDCFCISEGTYNFEINTKTYDAGDIKEYSLRITSSVPNGRSGVLVHGGRDDAKGWSQGCILPMLNEPKKDCILYGEGRNNTKVQSINFTKELIDWIKLRENEIKKRDKNIKEVKKQIIITKTF